MGPPLADLAALDDAAFRGRFAGTPIKRTGRDRFLRNVMIAVGNSGAPDLAEVAIARLNDVSPLVRGMAVWACGQLLVPEAVRALHRRHGAGETDAHVRDEWRGALGLTGARASETSAA